ncbi:crossover junction endodeoxyribonuclease RuvC [Dissulfurirhabdus thermomarina]|uniref:Crossover junction endodeoxyribonuclease RuvC n=1 Tax=Dissulfurirhabdus thermomarina TaxID=1765737 RepID=A0A6N9TKA7_DISTH|nr:crossover junction endodeoxyribonuclease RuvC [Dissulfurirhabdus thermomarina]NDY41701.1 crossover junction endodeoxyribonuclease RuvC [Dissulfurirhabdus thermomarina]NMX23186.1 crossover junction endodeoxyribonuclease RuvC [Dissulfurirhabdus thermomarina]
MDLILGIDPGSRATGFGLVAVDGTRFRCLGAGVLRTRAGWDLAERLHRIHEGLVEVIRRHRPTAAAVENVFQARNPRSALLLGHVRGVAILAAVREGIPVFEYTPTQVKQAVVGYGRAEKGQVQHMVRLLLNLERRPPQDAADALGVAVCHANFAAGPLARAAQQAGRAP